MTTTLETKEQMRYTVQCIIVFIQWESVYELKFEKALSNGLHDWTIKSMIDDDLVLRAYEIPPVETFPTTRAFTYF